ncbi:MAG: hypothetical protein LBT47_04005 [Deltaproteobacteria bacterium]|jgi:hypothetical protein|nr:hypothetical protein [Deltaproteobacteria bacterium]
MSFSYEPSGKFASAAIIMVPLVTAIASVILGVGYAFASWHNPIIYIGVVLPFLWALLVTLLAGWTLSVFPVRNSALAILLGLVGVLPGYAVETATWLALYLNQSPDPITFGTGRKSLSIALSSVSIEDVWLLLSNFRETFPFLLEVINEGVWSLSGNSVSGMAYKAIWAAELLIFLFFIGSNYRSLANRPFSEDEGKFLKKKIMPKVLMFPEGPDDPLTKLQNGDIGYIFVGPEETDLSEPHLKVTLFSLEDVDLPEGYLTVSTVVYSGKKKEKKESVLLREAGIPKVQVDQLLKKLG